MTSTPTRMPIWRPRSPQPWGSFAPMAANARDTRTADCSPAVYARRGKLVVPFAPHTCKRNHAMARVRSHGLEAAGQAAGAGDPGPAAGDVRGAAGGAARAPDRRAGQDRALPAHQRPQPRSRLRGAAAALPDLGGGAGCAGV